MKLWEVLDCPETNLEEKWTKKYKKSINCNAPKGFSQRAHCAARRKRRAGGTTTSKSVNEANNTTLSSPVRDQLNAWMELDQQYEDPTKRKSLQAKVWPYIQKNLDAIMSDLGPCNDGDYPAAPFAAWLLVQHMDAFPQNQVTFYKQLAKAIPNHPKLQFLWDRAAVNAWIQKHATNPKYYHDGKPLPDPTINVRNPDMFRDAGIQSTSREQALQNAKQAGNKLLVAAVLATDAQTQPSFTQTQEKRECAEASGTTKSKSVSESRMDTLVESMLHNLQSQGLTEAQAVAHIHERLDEDLRKWFKQKWVRFGPDGKIRGDCARGSEGEGKPKCLPQKKAWALGKKRRATAARRKRREDPNPERKGKAKNVVTKESQTYAQEVFDETSGPVYLYHSTSRPLSAFRRNGLRASEWEDEELTPYIGPGIHYVLWYTDRPQDDYGELTLRFRADALTKKDAYSPDRGSFFHDKQPFAVSPEHIEYLDNGRWWLLQPAARKRREDPNPERKGRAKNVATKESIDQQAGIGIDGQTFTFKIRDLVALAKEYPISQIDPAQFKSQLAGRQESPASALARAQKADLQYPIIVVKRKNGQLWIADGTHRVQKALMNNLAKISAQIIPVEDMTPFEKGSQSADRADTKESVGDTTLGANPEREGKAKNVATKESQNFAPKMLAETAEESQDINTLAKFITSNILNKREFAYTHVYKLVPADKWPKIKSPIIQQMLRVLRIKNIKDPTRTAKGTIGRDDDGSLWMYIAPGRDPIETASTVAHELTHALDLIKSQGKAFKSGSYEAKPDSSVWTADDWKNYIGNPMEINARFAQVLMFISDDVIENLHNDPNWSLSREELVNWITRLFEFYKIDRSWFAEGPKGQKSYNRLLSRTMQFYQQLDKVARQDAVPKPGLLKKISTAVGSQVGKLISTFGLGKKGELDEDLHEHLGPTKPAICSKNFQCNSNTKT